MLGGAGLISGGVDIYRAITGKNKDGSSMSSEEKQDSAFAGGTKVGMVWSVMLCCIAEMEATRCLK